MERRMKAWFRFAKSLKAFREVWNGKRDLLTRSDAERERLETQVARRCAYLILKHSIGAMVDETFEAGFRACVHGENCDEAKNRFGMRIVDQLYVIQPDRPRGDTLDSSVNTGFYPPHLN